jgi:hypothetical protein
MCCLRPNGPNASGAQAQCAKQIQTNKQMAGSFGRYSECRWRVNMHGARAVDGDIAGTY